MPIIFMKVHIMDIIKSMVKKWLVTNLLEVSTWVGAVVVVRELFAYNSSTLMLILGGLLLFVSDAKLNEFVKSRAPKLTKWIESL